MSHLSLVMNLSQEAGESTSELLFVNFNQDATYVDFVLLELYNSTGY